LVDRVGSGPDGIYKDKHNKHSRNHRHYNSRFVDILYVHYTAPRFNCEYNTTRRIIQAVRIILEILLTVKYKSYNIEMNTNKHLLHYLL
jgi:hypothetical protein